MHDVHQLREQVKGRDKITLFSDRRLCYDVSRRTFDELYRGRFIVSTPDRDDKGRRILMNYAVYLITREGIDALKELDK